MMNSIEPAAPMIPTLCDLLHQLDLGQFHSAFLEIGVTESSVSKLLTYEYSELESLLGFIAAMPPFHKMNFTVGIRKLRETIEQQQQQAAITSDFSSE